MEVRLRLAGCYLRLCHWLKIILVFVLFTLHLTRTLLFLNRHEIVNFFGWTLLKSIEFVRLFPRWNLQLLRWCQLLLPIPLGLDDLLILINRYVLYLPLIHPVYVYLYTPPIHHPRQWFLLYLLHLLFLLLLFRLNHRLLRWTWIPPLLMPSFIIYKPILLQIVYSYHLLH